jgi:NADH:ubiquinone oxidoreductase subunit D
MSRSVGIKRDIRLSKLETYSNYYYLNFRSFVGNHGDSYDRFLIRMNEMSESLNICNQVIDKIMGKDDWIGEEEKESGDTSDDDEKKYKTTKSELIDYISTYSNNNSYKSMEGVVSHFKV